jgi:glycosyltransferase involved in cell wall biosynthesis
MAGGNGRARQIVFFHNITPAEFMPEWIRPQIRRSFEQLRYFAGADRLWPFSSTSARTLIEAGLDPGRIRIVEPVIEWPSPGRFVDKPAAPVRLLFVGRLIESKGVIDLLRAVELLQRRCTTPFRLSLVGTPIGDAYLATVQDRVAALGADVELLGRVESAELERCYRSAHILAIPSYHEGFCRPVAEGLRAGCLPVGYASYHLPVLANGLGRLVAPGDVAALAAALQAMIESVAPALAAPAAGLLPLDRGPTSAAAFDELASACTRDFSFERMSSAVVAGIREVANASSSLRSIRPAGRRRSPRTEST